MTPDAVSNSNAAATLPSKRARSGPVVTHEPTFKHRLAAWIVYLLGNSLTATLRYHYTDRSEFFDRAAGKPAIYAVWHNRLLLCMKIYSTYAQKRNPTRGIALLISPSKDGAWSAAVHQRFGGQPVRGSTNRRGGLALRELTRWAKRGYDIGVTPDGPRGPRYVVQEGVMVMSQFTGLPIVPVSFHLSRKISLKSWDQLQIPLPFSRCDVILGKSISVPRNSSDAEREMLRQQLESELRAISHD